ncbi:MAG: stage II sporulation protein P [Clostridia bacterium]|nr:stage II sporulation protein P [Clostridia bacterium]
MFNVAIVNIKDIAKYLVSIIITVIIVMFLAKYFFDKNTKATGEKEIQPLGVIMQNSMLLCLDETIPGMKEINQDVYTDEDLIEEESILEKLLKIELGMFYFKEEDIPIAQIQNDEPQETNTNNQQKTNVDVNEIHTGLETEIVTPIPLADSYTTVYRNVKIKNETSYELTYDILGGDISINKENIVIFHTHTCESYTSSEQYPYQPTGNFRTTDNNYSVVRVGDELTNYLTQYGYNVIHNNNYHDYPTYTGSYTRSLQTVEGILANTSSDIIIDLHRDAISSNSAYAPTVRIGDDYAAQLMFVIGTNGGGLWHPNWNNNLQFAIKVQEKANEMYPGLFKPIILRNSRYNQHVGKAACIIEVGSTGNTLEQCLTSMKYLSKILNEI